MLMRRKGGGGAGGGEGEGNVFWVTMSDLLLGLAIIFMTLFVLAMTGFTTEKVKQQQAQIEASKELVEKLQEQDIKAEVDPMTGDVKISDLELFELNSYTLSPKGKLYLNKLVPIYVENIFSNADLYESITNIVVQGHTDSQQYVNVSSENEQFAKNMTLSLQRANSVAEYIFKTNFNSTYDEKLRKMLVVEGRSYSNPIIVDGKEDFEKSRRVELKLKVKSYDIMSRLGFTANFN
jgi:chemotaxis protein MotB